MQQTDAVYRRLLQEPDYRVETAVKIGTDQNALWFREDQLVSVNLSGRAFQDNGLGIGGALEGSCDIVIRTPEGQTARQLSATIPKAAEIRVYQRLAGEVETEETQKKTGVVGKIVTGVGKVGVIRVEETLESGWLIQGVYNINTRDSSIDFQLSIEGLDRMSAAEADFPPLENVSWPALDTRVVRAIATAMNVELDGNTLPVMNRGYRIPTPTNYSMREVLGYLATMYCGNFIITKDGKLLLLQLNNLPEETNYLVTTAGDFITIGGNRILVRAG